MHCKPFNANIQRITVIATFYYLTFYFYLLLILILFFKSLMFYRLSWPGEYNFDF